MPQFLSDTLAFMLLAGFTVFACFSFVFALDGFFDGWWHVVRSICAGIAS